MAGTSSAVVEQRMVAMRTLLLDALALRAVHALTECGIGVILLKGRVTANWLYQDTVRRYGDIDLLIDPARRSDAVEALAALGYRHWLAGADAIEFGPNEIELVDGRGTCIDLHHILLGVTADPADFWHVLRSRTETMELGGNEVRVLDPAARTMHLALHVAQNGPVDLKAVEDMRRGLEQLPIELWQEAEQIAIAVGALEAFSSGLGVIEQGREVRELLDLRPARDIGLILRSWSAPPESLQIQKLVEAGSLGRRLRFVGRKLWPTTAYMNGRNPAAVGGAALLHARVCRMAGLPAKFGVAIRAWNRARVFERHLDITMVSTSERKSL